MDLAEAFQPGESLVQEHRQWKSKSKHKSTGAGYKSHTFNDEADDSEPQKENLVQKPPCTILEAVRRKYKYKKPVGEDAGELVDEKILAHTGAKQELHLLTRVFIHDEHVVSAGEEGELGAACGAIEELDLEGNELQAWASIVTIAAQLPKLHWLGLNRLRLEPLGAALPEGFGSALGRLRSLCLSATGMTWAQLLMLAEATPELQELHFNGNAVSGFQPSAPQTVGRGRPGAASAETAGREPAWWPQGRGRLLPTPTHPASAARMVTAALERERHTDRGREGESPAVRAPDEAWPRLFYRRRRARRCLCSGCRPCASRTTS